MCRSISVYIRHSYVQDAYVERPSRLECLRYGRDNMRAVRESGNVHAVFLEEVAENVEVCYIIIRDEGPFPLKGNL